MDNPTKPSTLARARAALTARWGSLAVPNWRAVLKHAWSVRLDVLGMALTVAQAGVDVLSGSPPIDPVRFAFIAMGITALSLILRLVRQDKVSGGA